MVAQLSLWGDNTPNLMASNYRPLPKGITYRPHQVETVKAIKEHRASGGQRGMVVLPTGAGKTIVFSGFAYELGRPSVILAHRYELLQQTAAKIWMVDEKADIGIVQADRNDTGHQYTIASIQTLSIPRRFDQAFPRHSIGNVGLVTVDEAHHAAAPSYTYVLDRFGLMSPVSPSAPYLLGVTATPMRADKVGLDHIFDSIVYQMDMKTGISEGILSDLTGYTLYFTNEDMDSVKSDGGDFAQGQLDKAVKKVARCEAIVGAWLEQAKLEDGEYRLSIAFCTTVDHAEMLTEAFVQAGVAAEIVHGEMDEDSRRNVLARLKSGTTKVVCNVGVLTEGFDEPRVSCVIMARPTKSQGLYIQCLGRGVRLCPGKKNCLILDVADVSRKHSLTPAITLAGTMGINDSRGRPAQKIGSVAVQLKMRIPGAVGLGQGVEEADAIGGATFDPFKEDARVSYKWSSGASGMTLALPNVSSNYGDRQNEREHLVITPRADYLYDVVRVTKWQERDDSGHVSYREEQNFVNTHGLPDEPSAAQYAEKLVGKANNALIGKNAKWRNSTEGATDNQMRVLAKWGIRPKDGITKGEAAALLDQATARRVRVNIKRGRNDLEFV